MEVEHLKVKEKEDAGKQTVRGCRSTPVNPADIYTRKKQVDDPTSCNAI